MGGGAGDLPTPGEPDLQLILFRLIDREFAFPLRTVSEILPMVAVTAVTGSPGWLPGMINLRGRSLPVIDLRQRLSLPSAGLDLHAAIIVTDPPARDPVGFLVDRVLDVITLPAGSVDPVDTLGGEQHPVSALARVDDQMVLILDVARLTTSPSDLSLPAAFR